MEATFNQPCEHSRVPCILWLILEVAVTNSSLVGLISAEKHVAGLGNLNATPGTRFT